MRREVTQENRIFHLSLCHESLVNHPTIYQPLSLSTHFMHSRLPARTSVEFRGVDWAVEGEKSQKGFERRNTERQRRGQRKKQGKMSNEQLRSFLEFAVSNDENAQQALCMEHCDILLRRVVRGEFVTFPDDSLNSKEKVELLLEKFDSLKNDKGLRRLLDVWMNEAVFECLYSSQPKPSSPDSHQSTVSSELTDGTFETISLSSQNIADDIASTVIKAAVFAAYQVGIRRGHSPKELCKDLSKLFQTDQYEYIFALGKALALKEEEWRELDDDSCGEDIIGSHSSKSYIDELASKAHTAFMHEANVVGLNDKQVKALSEYCFVPLKRD